MDVAQFLDELGYSGSPSYLPVAGKGVAPSSVPDYGHIFRQAASEPCSLQGSTRFKPGQKDP